METGCTPERNSNLPFERSSGSRSYRRNGYDPPDDEDSRSSGSATSSSRGGGGGGGGGGDGDDPMVLEDHRIDVERKVVASIRPRLLRSDLKC